MSDGESESTIRKVVERLAARFPGAPNTRIEGVVREEFQSLASGRIRIYIPTLVENAARDRLHREFASAPSID
ncbi:three-helix bundle dimerization domain-containing protein [Arthrobacter sp. YAF17]|uniref:three-helix bundle dimerization domain-containing protein n=1 Tax=Arthrobacter sp. YAF17 TaxID=3233077 RepID=UPI003F8FBACA